MKTIITIITIAIIIVIMSSNKILHSSLLGELEWETYKVQYQCMPEQTKADKVLYVCNDKSEIWK